MGTLTESNLGNSLWKRNIIIKIFEVYIWPHLPTVVGLVSGSVVGLTLGLTLGSAVDGVNVQANDVNWISSIAISPM